MTNTIILPRSVVEQALEALESGIQYDYHGNPYSDNDAARCVASDALRAALAQPQVEQEPVEYWTVANGWVSEQAEVPAAAWVYPEFWDHCKNVGCGTAYGQHGSGRQPLYTCPQPKRQPLTDKEIFDAIRPLCNNDTNCHAIIGLSIDEYRAIERAHGIGGEK